MEAETRDESDGLMKDEGRKALRKSGRSHSERDLGNASQIP
jgi:hypothetical protein